MKNENYYIVHGWMMNDLHLKGSELTLYAILYGFTQDGKTEFRGGLGYLSEMSGICESKVRQNINNLVSKGLVLKTRYGNKTNGLRVIAPKEKQQRKLPNRKPKKQSMQIEASYDVSAIEEAIKNNDIVYERRRKSVGEGTH